MNTKLGYIQGVDKQNNVYSFLERHMQEHPDLVILKWANMEALKKWNGSLDGNLPHDSVSIKQLYSLSEKLASGFYNLGIKKGDRVILFIPMSLYLYASMFALQKIGAVPVFLDSWARRGELGVSAEVVDPVAMISVEQAFDLLDGVKQFDNLQSKIVLGPHQKKYSSTIEILSQTDTVVPTQEVLQDDTALITFTTGSSGTPKGANRTHRFLAAQHYALDRSLPFSSTDIDLPVFPIFSLNNIATGITTVLPAFDVGTPGANDALIIMAQMKANNINCMTLSPSLLNSVAKFCKDKNILVPDLKRVITGGAPVSRDNLIDFTSVAPNAEIWVLYGSTEVEPMAHIEAQEMINTKSIAESDPELVDEGVNVGKIDSGLKYKFLKINKSPIVLDQTDPKINWAGLVVKAGEVGELIVAGEHVCRDYYNNQEAFDRAKILDENGVVWHRTGDLARLDENEKLWLVGRVHNAINRNGKYAFPVRAEIILKKLEFVERCAYLGVDDSELGEKIVCVVEPKDKTRLDEEDVDLMMVWNKKINSILKKNKVVYDQLVFCNSIPMDSRHNSKVEYGQLRQQLRASGDI